MRAGGLWCVATAWTRVANSAYSGHWEKRTLTLCMSPGEGPTGGR
jgi:hypothetical protein